MSTAREEEFHPGTLKTSGHAPSWPPHLHCCHSSIPPSLAPFPTTCPGYGHPPIVLKSTCTVLLPCQNSFLLYQIQSLNCLQASSVSWPSLSLPPQAFPLLTSLLWAVPLAWRGFLPFPRTTLIWHILWVYLSGSPLSLDFADDGIWQISAAFCISHLLRATDTVLLYRLPHPHCSWVVCSPREGV